MAKCLNDLTTAELQELQNLAALFFTPRQVAQMLELPAEEFVFACEDPEHAIYKAFYAGRLQGEVDLRTGILKMAKAGSSPAQTMALDLLKQSTLKMLDR